MSTLTNHSPAVAEPLSWSVETLLARPGHERPLFNQRITIRNGKFAPLSTIADPSSGAGKIALPAFANAHDHGRGVPTLSVGIPDAPLEVWLSRLGVEPRMRAYLNAACAFARMAEAGIGSVVHCHNTQNGRALLEEARGVAAAAHAVGIRVAFAVPFAGENPLVYGADTKLAEYFPQPDLYPQLSTTRYRRTLGEGLAITEALAELESDTFTIQFGPVGPQWVDRKTLETLSARSAETGRRVHMHFLETKLQRDWADAHFHEGIIHYLDRIGLLSPRLTLAHGCWLRDEELQILAERGVIVSCNVSSNFRLSSGFPPITGLLRHGVRFGIGLDGMSLEDDEDILRETRLLRGITQSLCPGAEAGIISSDNQERLLTQYFDALFRGGREAITGSDGGGIIREGAPADFVIARTNRIMRNRIPDAALPELILTRLTRQDIETLVVGGKTVVHNGRCTGVSLPDLENELDTLIQKALSQVTDLTPVINREWEDGIRRYYQSDAHCQNTVPSS
ncbi:amidohydrolase family protein [Gluconobacter cerinus]|uniref:amidohydrolase family protein n=1 Tax=Gluconobacter cerinus TaxID=38307 RepID=UPI001B8B7939|nr:amidohydrolase family protein [Gluconobacter cerinus]MBS1072482.1 amidohydrolase family protein [Gluconobacter cerinus]MCW2266182.1 cytosine/adenosine deaminase-related metal-dependent hydrolase [Gluconobacter cerinus]